MARSNSMARGASTKQMLVLITITVCLVIVASWFGLPFTANSQRRPVSTAAGQVIVPPAPLYPQPHLAQVFLAASVDGGLPTTENLPPQPPTTPVTLYVIIAAQRTDSTAAGTPLTYYCGESTVDSGFPHEALVNGQLVSLARWQTTHGWSPLTFAWWTIRPQCDAQYTGASELPQTFPPHAQRWHDPEDDTWKRRGITPLYQETPLPMPSASAWLARVQWQDPANLLPGSTPAQYSNVVRYRVVMQGREQGRAVAISTPGIKAVIPGYGIMDSVMRVVWLRPYTSDIPSNELLLKYMGAAVGTACIYGGTARQFVNYIGMDCSKLPIFAWRQFGQHHDSFTTAQGLYNRALTGTYTMIVKDAPATRVPRAPVHAGDILLLMRNDGEGCYEHTFVFLGGGTGEYINTSDRSIFVHFNGWEKQGTSYLVAEDQIKEEWVNDEKARISVIRMK